MSKHVFS